MDATKAWLTLPYAPYWWGLIVDGMLTTVEKGHGEAASVEHGRAPLGARDGGYGELYRGGKTTAASSTAGSCACG